MDPLTHALVGGLSAQSVKASRRRFWIMLLLGGAPDLDVVFAFFGPWAFWLQHRGFTHSIPGALMQAFFYSAVFFKLDPGDAMDRFTKYLIPLSLHVFCDWLTSYGVPLFSPFSFREFSGDLSTAVTVVPATFMLIGVVNGYRKKKAGWSAVKPMWFGWIFYLLFLFASRSYAARLVRPVVSNAHLVAGVANPFRWTAVVESPPCCQYANFSVNVLFRKVTPWPEIKTAIDSWPVEASFNSPLIKRFVASSRWPMARVFPLESGGWSVEWGRMIFSSRGIVRGAIRARVSEDGVVTDETRIFNFWNPNDPKN